MIISIVVAAAENNCIGKDNQLLWHLPNDLKFFKNTTWGMPVIMGRKTFESVGKPLNGRTNIVVTRNENWSADGVRVAVTLGKALELAAETDAKEAYIIGGGDIYRQALPLAHRIYLTRVAVSLEGDTFFPAFGEPEWKLLSTLEFQQDEKHQWDYRFEVWERARS